MICNTLLQLFTTSGIIICFQGQPEGFTSAKNYFQCCHIRISHLEKLCNDMFQYFKAPSAGFLLKQLFWLFSGNFYKNISNRAHIQLSYELSIYTLLKWFSRNFLNLFRTPFNPLMPGGNTYLKQTFSQDSQVYLSMYVLLSSPALKG